MESNNQDHLMKSLDELIAEDKSTFKKRGDSHFRNKGGERGGH